jgi:tetratricopeptide (TPR) repeat protein
MRRGDLDLAIADFDRSIAIAPNDAVTYINRAWAYRRKGQYDRAWSDVDRAEQLGQPTPTQLLRELPADARGRD